VYRVLEENMILTNEPGIYFIEEILAEAKADKELSEYINWEKIGEYKKEVYGVRIEDNMVIT
jgi:Xaa-Pro aminopeptidase